MFSKNHIQDIAKFGTIVSMAATAIGLIGLQYKPEGWIFFFIGLLFLTFAERSFAKDMLLIFISLALLAFTPITTDISISHILIMGTTLTLAVSIPYVISRFVYKQDTIQYQSSLTMKWTRGEWLWLLFAMIVGYFLVPYFLKDTLSYLNWTITPGFISIFILFLGTNGLGIWDELFFVNTVLSLLRKHFSFWIANITQAILFTSFLYELGFRGWGPCMIFPFALAQGYIFRETKNLTYIITLHLGLDLILFLALLSLHHPDWPVSSVVFGW